MKAKELTLILQLIPEAEVLVSTMDYYEKSYKDVGYEKGSNQEDVCVNLNKKSGIIYLEGGEERKI
ncbi:hypothetical protein F6334_RS11505 [Enterococcus hirae]